MKTIDVPISQTHEYDVVIGGREANSAYDVCVGAHGVDGTIVLHRPYHATTKSLTPVQGGLLVGNNNISMGYTNTIIPSRSGFAITAKSAYMRIGDEPILLEPVSTGMRIGVPDTEMQRTRALFADSAELSINTNNALLRKTYDITSASAGMQVDAAEVAANITRGLTLTSSGLEINAANAEVKTDNITFAKLFSRENIANQARAGRNNSTLGRVSLSLSGMSFYSVGDTYYSLFFGHNNIEFDKLTINSSTSITKTMLLHRTIGTIDVYTELYNNTTLRSNTDLYGGLLIVFKFKDTYTTAQIDKLFNNASASTFTAGYYYESSQPSNALNGTTLLKTEMDNKAALSSEIIVFTGFYGANGFNLGIYSPRQVDSPILSLVGGSYVTRNVLYLTTVTTSSGNTYTVYVPSINGSSTYLSYRDCTTIALGIN